MPTLELPCGVQVAPGRVEKLIEVRKLSAKVQRDATSAEVKKNPALLNDRLIESNVLKVGGNPALSSLKNEMLMPDRAWLSGQLRKLTFGPVFKGTYFCAECRRIGKPDVECKMTHSFNIDDLEFKPMPDEKDQLWWDGTRAFKLEAQTPIELEDLRKSAKTRCFEVVDEKKGINAIFRYPNGQDERKIAPYGASDPPQEVLALHELLCRTLLKFNDTPRPRGADGFTLDFMDDLDLDVATRLEELYKDAVPGIQKQQEVECQHGHRGELELTSVDFLAPSASTD